MQTKTQGVGVSSTSTECLRGTSVCAGMYDKMNTCNDWRAGCKGRFQTSAHLCCQSQSRGSTPALIMFVNLGSETLWWWCWWWSKKTNGCKSPDKETLLPPYSLSELQTVESGRTWYLRSEMKSTSYWFAWWFWIQGNIWQPNLYSPDWWSVKKRSAEQISAWGRTSFTCQQLINKPTRF